MDENGLRALLRELAEDELPPVRVSVDLAARKGRRKLRWRRIYLPGAAPIAAAAAVAVIVGFLTATGTGLHRGQSGPVAPVGLPAVPEQFSALVPYAAFGWLPKGYSPDGLASQTLLSTSQLQLTAAAAGGRLYTISFNAARVCRLTGPYVLKLRTTVTFPHGLECSGGLRFPLIGKAFDVKGAPAYWVNEHSSLVWEYGHNAWADLTPAQPMPEARLRAAPVLRRIASTIRYAARPVVRYGFTISGLPTAWQAGPPGSADSVATFDGRLGNVSWEAGPADEPGALTISVSPTAAPKICDYSGKPNIMVDGVRARMRTDTNKGHKYIQLVCAQGVRGMQLFITLDLSTQGSVPTPLPGGRQVGTIRTVLSHLRLLGPDLADWTTRPQG